MLMHKAKFPAQFQYLDEIREYVAKIAIKAGFDSK